MTKETMIHQPVTPAYNLASAAVRHPLVTYFVLAFAGTWIVFLPIYLGQGLKLFNLPVALGLGLFILSTYTGPFAAAVVTTRLLDGQEGVKRLLRRLLQWRVGLGWYLLVLLGYPLVLLAGVALVVGPTALSTVPARWPLFFSVFLPLVLLDLFMPGFGEETGWRGFA